jgi:sugar lactone lactonase YvrE
LGSGILAVTVTAPPGVTPTVVVDGPTGYSRSLTGSQSLTGLAPGSYTVTGMPVEVVLPIAHTMYDPTVTGGTGPLPNGQVSASVSNGQTVRTTVSYALRPGTGSFWVTSGEQHVRAYSATALRTGGTPAPAIDFVIHHSVPTAVAFDALGNLWTATNDNGDELSGTSIMEFPPNQLRASGDPVDRVALTVTSVAGAFLQGLAFDFGGNLWVTNKDANTILEFTTGQLGASGGVTPAVTLSAASGSLNGPAGIAFDANGNLWIANYTGSTVVEFTENQFATSGSRAPTVTLSATNGSLDGPFGLVFDTEGNLWVTNRNANTVVGFGASQLTASGSPTPTVTLSASGGSLAGPSGVAFDASGNLWVVNDVDRSVVEFGASQLTATGAPIPVATIGGLGPSGPIALAFDAPTGVLYPYGYFPWGY